MSFITNGAKSVGSSIKNATFSAVGTLVNTTTSAASSAVNFATDKTYSLASKISSKVTGSKKIKKPTPIDIKTIDEYRKDTEKYKKEIVKKTYYVALIQGMYFAQNWFSIYFRKTNFVSMEDTVQIITEIEKSDYKSLNPVQKHILLSKLMNTYIKEDNDILWHSVIAKKTVNFFTYIPSTVLSAIIFYYMNYKGAEKIIDDVFTDILEYIRNFSSDSKKASSLAAKSLNELTKFLNSYNDLIKEFNNKLKLKDESTLLSNDDEKKLREEFNTKMLKKDLVSKLSPNELCKEFDKYKYKHLRDRYIIDFYKNNKYLDGNTQKELYNTFSKAITDKFIKDFKLFKSENLGKKFIKSVLLDNMMECGIQNTIESLSNPAFMGGLYEMFNELISDNINILENPPKKDDEKPSKPASEINEKEATYFQDFGKTFYKTLKSSSCSSEQEYHKLINSNFNPLTDHHKLIKTAKDLVDHQLGDDFTNRQINDGISLLMKEAGKITLNLIQSENLEKYLAMTAKNLCKVYEKGPKKDSKEYYEQQQKFIDHEKKFYVRLNDLLDTLYETSKVKNVQFLKETITEHRPKLDVVKDEFKKKATTEIHEKIDQLREDFETLSNKEKLALKEMLQKLHQEQTNLFNHPSFKALEENKFDKQLLEDLKNKLNILKLYITTDKANKSKPFIDEFNNHLHDINNQINSTLKKINDLLDYKTRFDELQAKKLTEINKVKLDNEKKEKYEKEQKEKPQTKLNTLFSYLNPEEYSFFKSDLESQLKDINIKYAFKINNLRSGLGINNLKQNLILDLKKLKELSAIFEDEITWKKRLKNFIDPRNLSIPNLQSVKTFSKIAIPALIMGYFFPISTALAATSATGAYLAKNPIKKTISEQLDPLADKTIEIADQGSNKLLDIAEKKGLIELIAEPVGNQVFKRYAKPIVNTFTIESLDLAQRAALHHGLIHNTLAILTKNLKN
jgi:hypothetical protein